VKEVHFTLKTEAASSFETLISYTNITRRHNPENFSLGLKVVEKKKITRFDEIPFGQNAKFGNTYIYVHVNNSMVQGLP
jgi:hypothetical protein